MIFSKCSGKYSTLGNSVSRNSSLIMNYQKFLNPISAARSSQIIMDLMRIATDLGPDTISLSTGFPCSAVFPFASATLKIADGTMLQINEEEMKDALQYQHAQGMPGLLSLLKDLVHDLHHPPSATEQESDILVMTGCQDAFCKCIEMLISVGDSIIAEQHAYVGTVSAMLPYKPDFICLESDQDGMRPDKLREILAGRRNKSMPKFLYINPTGANPSGTILSLERRREIYKLCSEYDILILEDDPYFFVHFLEEDVPSFYSMDVDRRVIRFDSFSKIVSPGIRLAFAVGPKPLMERLLWHIQASTQHTSSLSQVFVEKLMRHWGPEGFMKNARFVKELYRQRRDVMQKAAEKHLKDLCEWNQPVKGLKDTWDLAAKNCMKKKVLIVPGKAFSIYPDKPSPFLRASFSIATDEEIDVGFEKLAAAIVEARTTEAA